MAMSMGSFATRVVATIVVALDGTGDTDDIQEGIDLLPAGGGSVYVREGVFTIPAILTMGAGVSIIGSGYSTSIVAGGAFNTINISHGYCTIENVRITGGAGITYGIRIRGSPKIMIRGCWIENCNSGIRVENDNPYILITGNTITNNTNHGINLDHTNGAIVQGNIVYSNGLAGVVIGGNSVENIINGNVLDDNGTVQIDIYGDKTVVTGNTVVNGGNIGIRTNAVADRSLISSNTVLGNAGAQITDNGTNTEFGYNITV